MDFVPTKDQEALIDRLTSWYKNDTKNKPWYAYSGAAGTGKAQPDDTPIPTPNGFKILKNLEVGDEVFNIHGNAVKILGVYPQGKRQAFQIELEDGRSTKSSDDHLWRLYNGDTNDEPEVVTLKKIQYYMNEGWHPYLPIGGPINYPEQSTPLSPWAYGFLCGNILLSNPLTIACEDAISLRMGYRLAKIFHCELTRDTDIMHGYKVVHSIGSNDPYWLLDYQSKGIGEFIPDCYKFNSIKNRKELLMGLLDSSDAKYIPELRAYRYSTRSKRFANDIADIARSLGFYAKIDNAKGLLASVMIDLSRESLRIEKITPLDEDVDQRCIYIDDPDHVYITENYIPTHNTTVIKAFIDRMGFTQDEYICVAYVGKAVLNLQRHELPSSTIHSLIYRPIMEIIKTDDGRTKRKIHFVKKDELSPFLKLIVIDEGTMVNDPMRDELLSFGIPLIFLGDMNQLPPVFGASSVMLRPDFTLRQIMRQAEDDPIVQLSQMILRDEPLYVGAYGSSNVFPNYHITDEILKYGMIICAKNMTKDGINTTIHEQILQRPSNDLFIGDTVICKQNNWGIITDNFSLTNGLIGKVIDVDRHTARKGFYRIAFQPDFMENPFEDIELDLEYFKADYATRKDYGMSKYTKFEFGWAITAYASQGSEADKVLFFDEGFGDPDLNKRTRYTAVTRARELIDIVPRWPRYRKRFY